MIMTMMITLMITMMMTITITMTMMVPVMVVATVVIMTTISGIREAARQGADLIECDLALTKDHALICSHAPYLRSTLKHTLKT